MVNNQGETPLLYRGLIFTEQCQGGEETSCLKLDAVTTMLSVCKSGQGHGAFLYVMFGFWSTNAFLISTIYVGRTGSGNLMLVISGMDL